MSPNMMIRKAASAGVTLKLTQTGTLLACGDKELVSKWDPVIHPHKADIIAALSDAQSVERTNVPFWKPARRSKLDYGYDGKRRTNHFLLLDKSTKTPIGNNASWYEQIVINVWNKKHLDPFYTALTQGCAGIPEFKVKTVSRRRRKVSCENITLNLPTNGLIKTLCWATRKQYEIERVTVANKNETPLMDKASELEMFLRTHVSHKSQVLNKRGLDLVEQARLLLLPDAEQPVFFEFSSCESSQYSEHPSVITSMTFQNPSALKSAGLDSFEGIWTMNLWELWQREMVLRSTTFDTFDEVMAYATRKYEKESIGDYGREKTERMIRELAEMYSTPLPADPDERYINGRQQKALQFEFYKGGRDTLRRLDNRPLLPLVHIDNAELLTGGMYCPDEVSDDAADES